MSSPLFERINMCVDAIRYIKGEEENGTASYERVMQYLPVDKKSVHRNTNLIRASLEFLKMGFGDPSATTDREVKIALCIALSIADNHSGLSKAIYERCRCLTDFDRSIMTKIFHFSTCNERVLALLDSALVMKTKKIHPRIELEFRVEFIALFLNTVESLTRRGYTLTDVGLSPQLAPCHLESVREFVEKHASQIAIICGKCFCIDALKKPRVQNTLFPARGALPRVSIGRDHIDYDQATIGTLTKSLLEGDERRAFLEIMNGAISRAMKQPVTCKRESVKALFLEKVEPSSEDADTEVCKLRAEVDLLNQRCSEIGEKYRSLVCKFASIQAEIESDFRFS